MFPDVLRLGAADDTRELVRLRQVWQLCAKNGGSLFGSSHLTLILAHKSPEHRISRDFFLLEPPASPCLAFRALSQEHEKHAANTAARTAAETDLQKSRHQRKLELQMQAELAPWIILDCSKMGPMDGAGPRGCITRPVPGSTWDVHDVYVPDCTGACSS